jgi:hypothetical protein
MKSPLNKGLQATELPRALLVGRMLIGHLATVGVQLRLFGSCAIWELCEPARGLLRRASRFPKDIDAIIEWKCVPTTISELAKLGWYSDEDVRAWSEGQRLQMYDAAQTLKLDLCVDELPFAQTLDLRGRLTVHDITIAPTDLLLSKIQIMEMTRVDLIDILAILLSSSFGPNERTNLSPDRVKVIITSSWRWYKATQTALDKFRAWFAGEGTKLVTFADAELVEARLQELQEILNIRTGRSFKWFLEAAKGIVSGRWYRHVDAMWR